MLEFNQLKFKKNYLLIKQELKTVQELLSTGFNEVKPYSETLSENIWECFKKVNNIKDLLTGCIE